ncbi:ABC transporter substrate-binding protein [Marinivivus vitaminiproducens]|uniref:ABC transporter substrate-binding protein n=1 Tax=Marinivivus vitaminiproducens TaxID=3035935 RepID=UPI0027A623B2|nr:ABC transporter substrate-binding protein [Geminicoccaceae bacterium SCSIO 64248]
MLATAAVLLSAAAAQAQDLTVTSWGGSYQDAQREIYFNPFKEESGVNVIEDSWNGGIGALRARVEGGNAGWDVVQVEAEELTLGCDEGLYEEIDWDALGGRDAFIPAAVHDCGVGAIVWSTILTYDGNVFQDQQPQSWADFFDTEAFPGKRGMRRIAKYTLEIALMADGVPPSEVYETLRTPEGVDRAFAKLDTIKDDIVWWESGAQPIQLLGSGEVAMTLTYNGRVTSANKSDNRNFKMVWPGSVYAVDSWVIIAGSPNAEAGMDFIKFASAPEHQKDLPQYIAYGLTNAAANDLVPAEYAADLPTSPDNIKDALELDTEFWVDNSDALTARFNTWVGQ